MYYNVLGCVCSINLNHRALLNHCCASPLRRCVFENFVPPSYLLPFQLALKRPSMELGVTQVVQVLAYFWFFSYLSLICILALDESGDADCNIL